MKTCLLIIAIAFQSCSPTFYMPNSQNVPAFTKPNTTKAAAAVSPFGFDAFVAHSPMNHFGMLANITSYKSESFEGELYSDGEESGQLYEIGLGYYRNISRFSLECYGLMAHGKYHYNTINFMRFNANISRISIQPSVSYILKNLELSMSARLSSLHYSNYKATRNIEIGSDLGYIIDHPTHFLIEPAFTVKLGLKNVKLFAQFIYSHNATHNDSFFVKGNEQLGITVNF